MLPRRSGGGLPYWQDIRAQQLANVMPHVWVLEHVPPFSMYVRFMGTDVTRLGGRDTTGDDFLNTRIPAEHRAYIMGLYKRCYHDRCGVSLIRTVSPLGSYCKKLRTTFLPIENENSSHWMLLGCSYMEDSPTLTSFNDAGTADYGIRRMEAPYFFDIGFGLPALDRPLDIPA